MKFFSSHSDKKILKKVQTKFPNVKEAIIISNEGMPLKSTLSLDIESVKIAGIALAILSAAKKLVSEIKSGKLNQLIIKTSEGYLIGEWLSKNKLIFVFSEKEIDLKSIL